MLFGFVLLAFIASSTAYQSCFENTDVIDETIKIASANLEALGYDISYGHLGFQNFCFEDSPTCWGQNPSSPYGRYMVSTPLFQELASPIWQLRPDEALIFYGCTPPPNRYFGLQSYAFISKSKMLFADMTDSTNNFVMNTSQPQYPYDTNVLFITTGDRQANHDVRSAFFDSGVSESVFNNDIIPNVTALGLDNMGIGLNNTVFATLFRIAECENTTFCSEYYNKNWTIIRATPKTARPGIPFAVPPYKNRTWVTDESYLNSSFLSLVDLIIKKEESLSVALKSRDNLLPFTWDGRQCISEDINCVGDTRDACYMDGDVELGPLPPLPEHFQNIVNNNVNIAPNGPQYILGNSSNDFIIVVGVIHSQTTTPLATYTNLAVYNVDKDMGVFAVMDTGLTGSTQQYGDSSNYFYSYKFARNCDGQSFCFSVPTTFPGVPLELPLSFVERAYVNPHTTVGPDPNQLIFPIILQFTSRII